MDNQHKKIAGYRDLSQLEIDLMNGLKEMEASFGDVLHGVEEHNAQEGDREANRWASLARTHAEIAFMFAIKAVARPTNGLGRR